MAETENPERAANGGLRERKRLETRRRITEAGLRLFGAKGYEATTLDEIAAAAGISRRTFFHYFKSKDDILLSLQAGHGERLAEALADRPPGVRPLAAVRAAMMRIIAPYSPEEMLVLDRLMRSSEAVQARKQAGYLRDEGVLFAALRQHWPAESETELRLVAMIAIGVTRLSLDAWSRENGARTFATHLDEGFDAIGTVCR